MPDIRRQETISQQREDTAQQVLESAQRTLTEEGPGQEPNGGPAPPHGWILILLSQKGGFSSKYIEMNSLWRSVSRS